MTEFERLCNELEVPITLDDYGLYSGICRALASICCDVIMNGEHKKPIEAEIKDWFYAKFPYMKK